MVLLGFLDEPKSTKNNGVDDDPKNWTISRIGGEPVCSTETENESRNDIFHLFSNESKRLFPTNE